MLLKEDLNTHMYSEIITTISRDEADLIDESIEAAIGEAEGYLGRFDIDTLFTAEGDDRDKVLLMYLKDITVWHFLAIANPDTDIDYREKRYRAAIKWLEKVQSAKVTPKGWPLTQVEGADESWIVTSRKKRITNY